MKGLIFQRNFEIEEIFRSKGFLDRRDIELDNFEIDGIFSHGNLRSKGILVKELSDRRDFESRDSSENLCEIPSVP